MKLPRALRTGGILIALATDAANARPAAAPGGAQLVGVGDDARASPPAPADPILGDDTDEPISTGALGVLRIDGKGRGFAGGLGVVISGARLDAEIMFLKADRTGGYVGARYRLLTGSVRPYAALGMPGFVYDEAEMGTSTEATRLAIGVRGAVGVELVLGDHLSVHADLGGEHFFNVSETNFDADVFVPTLGVIGRL